jgi:double zinc ribbon protein
MGLAFTVIELSTFGTAIAVAAALLFALLRPHEDDRSRLEHRLHVRLLEEELHAKQRCLECLTPIRPDFRCCPGCGEELRVDCPECGRLLGIGWTVCPWCLGQATMRRSLRPSDVAA